MTLILYITRVRLFISLEVIFYSGLEVGTLFSYFMLAYYGLICTCFLFIFIKYFYICDWIIYSKLKVQVINLPKCIGFLWLCTLWHDNARYVTAVQLGILKYLIYAHWCKMVQNISNRNANGYLSHSKYRQLSADIRIKKS